MQNAVPTAIWVDVSGRINIINPVRKSFRNKSAHRHTQMSTENEYGEDEKLKLFVM